MPVREQTAPAAEELLAAATEVIDAAKAAGATVRLLGGVAVFQLAPSASKSPLARTYHDFDVFVPARQGALAARVFREAGYDEDRHFNALHGAQRLIFGSPRGFVVDVVVGTFRMCHELDLGRDLPGAGLTIHPADLLLTKLQIVQIEEKDLLDAVALLTDLPTDGAAGAAGPAGPAGAAGAAAAIDVGRFVTPLAGDWGFYHTVEQNMPKVMSFARDRLGASGAQPVLDSGRRLLEAMHAVPKSMRWKIRSRAGEKVTWYELPEEPGHSVGSR
jgi:hypothetical protein